MKNKSFMNSLINALQGLQYLIKNERNFKIQGIIALVILIVGFVFHISTLDWLLLLIAMILVFICEAFNTALEVLCNKVESEYCKQIMVVKDIGAAAVTLASILAIFVGIYVFLL